MNKRDFWWTLTPAFVVLAYTAVLGGLLAILIEAAL